MSKDIISSVSEVQQKLLSLKDLKKKIGFTNGCFDLLHKGHISLLSQAKQKCDFLILALNSNESVKQLKGEGRPIEDENIRAKKLFETKLVDCIILFEQKTPIELIRVFKPDVLVKGSDYKDKNIIGKDFVERYGGSVILAKIIPGYSTTDTIKKMNYNL